ncbi:MAG: hypothetical protein AB1716_06565 [Planctomycetota bacterium]
MRSASARPCAPCGAASDSATCAAVLLISAAVIAYEVVLMRRLLVEHWHHFGYLVISVALLGFGASGSVLALLERRVRARPQSARYQLAFGLAVALLTAPRLAALLPITARFIPGDLGVQLRWWALYWLVALVPFLLGALFLGAALMTAGARVGRVYACNLFGSGAGAVLAALLISRFPLERALWPPLALACAAALVVAWSPMAWPRLGRTTLRVLPAVVLLSAALAVEITWPLTPRYDEHKYAAHLERLVAQGSARRVDRRADPHGYVELFESALFHDLPFLALREAPPPMYSLAVNGDPGGSMLRITSDAQAGVMDGTLMAFPYRLIEANPYVLLIGESGGANVWLARRRAAARIDVVQPNVGLVALVRRWGGGVLDAPPVYVAVQDPRRFLASVSAPHYNLIQIVALEGLAVGGAGVRGLAEDHLVTVEGLASCLRALRDDGLVAISRGLEEPASANIRLFATLVAALESLGVADPARHMIQVRDYLGVCTLAARRPLDDARRARLRAALHDFNLTPVWYDGLRPAEVNQPDALSGPPGTHVDWLHYAATEILSPRRAAFYDSWLLNVRPTRDDQPFFWDFYKPQALPALRRAYGALWLTRAELGRLFLYASLAIGAAAAVALILAPLLAASLWRWRCAKLVVPATLDRGNPQQPDRANSPSPSQANSHPPGQANSHPSSQANPHPPGQANSHPPGQTGLREPGGAILGMLVYFSGIGLGFMAVEMALISRAIHWLGDPVIASAVVIGGVLVVSGAGSLLDLRIAQRHGWLAPALVALTVLTLRLVGWCGDDAAWRSDDAAWRGGGAAWSGVSLFLAAAAATALLMGMPMPAGLAALDRRRLGLVPWAWGVNGVASVIATSAATAVAMTAGYRLVMLLAAAAYAVAALAAGRLWAAARKPSPPLSAPRARDIL